VKVGQRVKVLPSGVESTVARIVTFDGDLQEAHAGEAITLVLKDEIDISRGDLLVDAGETCRGAERTLMWCGWRSSADARTELRHQSRR
jgi:sulfate adenylyltransferase subunit 1